MNIGTIVELVESLVKSTAMTSNEGAYGSGMAGGPFDPIAFIKKPQVILRILGIVFSIIVFASIASEDSYSNGKCPMDNDPGACGLGVTFGVVSFLILLVFLVVDARFDSFSSVKIRRRFVIADMGISGFIGAIQFIVFCYIANAWRATSDESEEKAEAGLIRLALAFSFFSIFIWAMLCLLNFLRYRQGVSSIFNENYEDPNPNFDAANAGGQMGGADNYRQAPFNNNANAGYQHNY